MLVYLDACCLQRPLDDRRQPRVNVEAEAVLTILGLVEAGELDLLSSEALEFEMSSIPDRNRQARGLEILALADRTIELSAEVEALAARFSKRGVKPLDAIHVASACLAKASYFCTCDDKPLKKAKKLSTLDTKVASPLQLVAEVAP